MKEKLKQMRISSRSAKRNKLSPLDMMMLKAAVRKEARRIVKKEVSKAISKELKKINKLSLKNEGKDVSNEDWT